MVMEVLAQKGFGGLRFALEIMEKSLQKKSARSWCMVEASSESCLYPPALSRDLRLSVPCGKLFWVRTTESGAPAVVQRLLESTLCEGVMVRGLEKFARSSPASVWGRRWQLAAHKSDTHLLWVHEKPQAVIGFDVRLEWTARGRFEIKKGHGYFDASKQGDLLGNGTQPPAARAASVS